jgi:hypothetical protein
MELQSRNSTLLFIFILLLLLAVLMGIKPYAVLLHKRPVGVKEELNTE